MGHSRRGPVAVSVPGAALIWCPFADEDSAAAVAGTLLDEGHVSCANILPGLRSLYVWNGERGEGSEVAVLFKTGSDRLENAVRRLEALHPYDAPAVVGWHCSSAGAATLEWLNS